MSPNFSVEKWLAEHSVKVHANGHEILFEYSHDDYSVLLLHPNEKANLTVAENPTLPPFYQKYAAGSIGDGFLLMGAA